MALDRLDSKRLDMTATSQKTSVHPDFAEEFAAFTAKLRVEHLPDDVIEMVKTDIFDTLACAMAGITATGVSNLTETVMDWGGKPEATIWGTGVRVPAHHAAWVNGMMSHARDFDDLHVSASLHAGVSVIPAAIAAAEITPGATGADLVAGIAAGLELASRLGLATTVSILESGYLYTSLYGHFAATVAAARVMRFDKEQTINALGIAYSQAAGTHQVTRDSSLTKRMQPGFAAKTALISVAMVKAGITGARHTFEGEDGLFMSYLHGNYNPARLRAGLGRRFDLLGLSYKLYPCCGFAQVAIATARELRKKVTANKIKRLTAYVNRATHEIVGSPIEVRRAPQTSVQAQFSIPYTVACALLNDTVTLKDFTDEGIRNPQVRELSARILVEIDEDIERERPGNMAPVRLVAETDAGRLEVRVDHPSGSLENPMTRADFDLKMEGCLEISGISWPSDQIQQVRTVIDELESASRGSVLITCLAPAQHPVPQQEASNKTIIG